MTDVTKESWFWISFQDMAKPKGQRFVACCMVRARDKKHLLARLKVLNLLPKAEDLHAGILPIPEGATVLTQYTYRLLNREESIAYAKKITN